jgi:hypothetical protein
MNAKKLDRRHTGSAYFKYAVEFTSKEGIEFCQIREWCWEQWGPSCEMEFFYKVKRDAVWAWINDQYRIKIYFKSDKEYQWFILKWQ